MPIWITVPEPIARNFHNSSAVTALAFPPRFVSFDPPILDRAKYKEVSKLCPGKIIFQLANYTATRACSSAAERVGGNKDLIPAFTLAQPDHFTGSSFVGFCQNFQLPKNLTGEINACWRRVVTQTATRFRPICLTQIGRGHDHCISAFALTQPSRPSGFYILRTMQNTKISKLQWGFRSGSSDCCPHRCLHGRLRGCRRCP